MSLYHLHVDPVHKSKYREAFRAAFGRVPAIACTRSRSRLAPTRCHVTLYCRPRGLAMRQWPKADTLPAETCRTRRVLGRRVHCGGVGRWSTPESAADEQVGSFWVAARRPSSVVQPRACPNKRRPRH
jgi:hypothetical protein